MQLRLKEHWKLVALGLALIVAIAFIVVSARSLLRLRQHVPSR
ncbi:hypothetical protein QM646_18530 [Rhodococcus erythropolis]|nr:hypothetical protein [Rhodococcus erythropolis]